MANSEELRRQAPYYDDFDPSKQYSQILAVPGRVEQAREFTQIQSLIFHYLKKLSDTFFKDGNIVSGMNFSISADKKLTIEDGKVYISGKIHEFKKQTITITKTGREVIGVKLNEAIITEAQDTSLLDPSLNMGNFSQPGAHRIKSEPVLTLNDLSAPVLYELQDGELFMEVSKPSFDGLTDVLAKRTFDESGNYRVSGMDLNVEPLNANDVQVVVEAGTSYVMGYQITKPTPVKVPVPISKTVKAALNEPKTYSNTVDKYALNNFPSKQITRVVGTAQVSNESVTRGSVPNGIDYLSRTAIVSITSVTQGGTTFIQGTDYQLTSDGVSWALGGAEPAVGSSYTVTYRYNRTFINGTDYQLYQEDGEFGTTKDYIKFLNGIKPVNATQFTVDYDFFLSRVDLISLDRFGNINVTTGESDIPRLVTPPVFRDPTQLVLGTVYLPPNAGNAKANTTVVSRLDMAQIQRMAKRLDDVEYNQAITALDQEAMAGELPTDLKGVFSDSFRSSTKGDLGHALFTAMYSLEDGQLMTPLKTTKTFNPVVSGTTTAKPWRRLITNPYAEVVEINQPYATTTMKINPYLAFNSLALLQLTPEVDNWIETDYIKIEEIEFEARNYYKWWLHANEPWLYEEVKDLINLPLDGGGTLNDWRPPAGHRPDTEKVTVTKTEKSTNLLKEALTYMRQTQVKIKSTNLEPSTDNLEAFFDGVRVTLTPVSGYQAGATAGTVRANTSGVVEATFTIPSGIRTGTREVILRNGSNNCSAPYTSIGTKETTVDTIVRTRIAITAVDPLAQSFQFDKATILTSVGVYFSAKDNVNNVVAQIRNVVNGYPGNVIYGEKVLTPAEIKVSANATLETKVTFDDPIVCEANTQYCVVYMVNSSVHTLYVSDLGQKDITTGELVAREPYLAGVLFSSSNAITWTAHQSMNLKFKVYVAKFQTSSVLQFDPITGLGIDKLLLIADSLTPQNTGCVWEVSLDDRVYQPLTSMRDIDTGFVVNKAVLRCRLSGDERMSPIVAKDSATLVGFATDTSGTYVSRMTELEQDVLTVKQAFDAYVPVGCTVVAQFSLDDGVTWLTPTQTSATQVSADWTRYVFEKSVNLPNQRKFRARINITANNALARPRVRKFMNIMK